MATKKVGRDSSTGKWVANKADVGRERTYKAGAGITTSFITSPPRGGYTWSKKDIKEPSKSPAREIAVLTPTRVKAIAAHEMSDQMIADIDRTIAEHKGKPTDIKRVKLG